VGRERVFALEPSALFCNRVGMLDGISSITSSVRKRVSPGGVWKM